MRPSKYIRDIREVCILVLIGQPDKKEVINVQLTSSVRVSEWLFRDRLGG